jgi:hypothetical protein
MPGDHLVLPAFGGAPCVCFMLLSLQASLNVVLRLVASCRYGYGNGMQQPQRQQQAPRRRAVMQQQAPVQYAPPAQPSRKARRRGGAAPVIVYQAPPPQPRQPQYVTRVVQQQPAPIYAQPARTVQHVVHMRPDPTLVRVGVSHGGMGGAPAPVPAHLAARMQPAPQPQRTVYVHHQQPPPQVMHHAQGNGSGYFFAEQQAPVVISRGGGAGRGGRGGRNARMSAYYY